MKLITNNPYRILGVLSDSPLRERVGNQNRLTAFAKVGREVAFPNDFIKVVTEKPLRTSDAVASATKSINLDKDQLKFALFWFIKGSPMDEIALKHLQMGNIDKAKEIFQKKETFASLINNGVLAFVEGDVTTGFLNISKVIHNQNYRSELLQAIGIANLVISEDELASLFITELLKEVPAKVLLSGSVNDIDRAIISKIALDEPISAINSAISIAKNADTHNAVASLEAGMKLMSSTKAHLKEVRDLAGATSSQYQMVADSLAKQILQCGINYYNNAPDSDVESPRKAMVLQSYALSIAVGQLTKDRCKENYDILKQAVDNMPPAEVAIEARKVKEELRKFCQLPDKISHSVTLLNNTKPLLQIIKSKLGATNAFYLSLSTQVVGNALHNIIEEVNQAQNAFGRMIEECKRRGINPSLVGSTLLDNIKPVLREAWKATLQMDSFDMEYEFKTNKYNPNRQSLKELCESLDIPTRVSTTRVSTTRASTTRASTTRVTPTRTTTTRTTPITPPSSNSSTEEKNSGWPAFWIATLICAVIGAMANGGDGFICGGLVGLLFIGNIARAIFKEE